MEIYLARLGGERCNQLYTLTRPVGALEDLLSLDLGFGHIAPKFLDVEISNEEADHVDFGGYAFHEGFFAFDTPNIDVPLVMQVYEVKIEDFIVGSGPNHNSLVHDYPKTNFP